MAQGSGETVPVSPRTRSLPPGSPLLGRGRSQLSSPTAREAVPGSPQAETMGKAKELFVLCDKEGKGFITKRDMQVSRRQCKIKRPKLVAEPLTFYHDLNRGYKKNCRCHLNSWRRCLRVWIDGATASSLLLSSIQDLVSDVYLVNFKFAIRYKPLIR